MPSCPFYILSTYVQSTTGLWLMVVPMLRNYNTLEERSFKEWSSILDLSTRWGFTSIRDLAIRCIKSPNPVTRLVLARKHGVEQWILPALLELCEWPEPLSLEEARLMDFEDVVLVGSVRQTVRSSSLIVRGAEIRSCIRAWKRGEPWSPVSDIPDDRVRERKAPSPYEKCVDTEPGPAFVSSGIPMTLGGSLDPDPQVLVSSPKRPIRTNGRVRK